MLNYSPTERVGEPEDTNLLTHAVGINARSPSCADVVDQYSSYAGD